MGDNALILGQRVSAWCGHAPVLEEDIAMANVGLDLIGQAKLWLTLAGEVEGAGRDADALAFLRDSRDFRNVLLVEQPNGDYGRTLMRQFLFDAWHLPILKGLRQSGEARVADIAGKCAKEAAYHLDRSSDLVIRLGDGTAESRARMQAALDFLFPFVAEMTAADAIDDEIAAAGLGPRLADITREFSDTVAAVSAAATLALPSAPARTVAGPWRGKAGRHTEEFGRLLAEMQWMQRAYPGVSW
ncbi:MAG TPA: phenylacetate-CoA oxygenase subunit PaaI [Parvularcula sp.]|nr:phenylacetate-CoA oxygenase subunit PaaI [Parvularcula sp.]HBS32680.1 phenylacetate-CoA oxygenase subunit PaaI [Parvularcula sp.]